MLDGNCHLNDQIMTEDEILSVKQCLPAKHEQSDSVQQGAVQSNKQIKSSI